LDRTHLRRYHEYSEREILRPGVIRLSFTYFMSQEAVDYIITAVAMTAKHGWKLLPQYLFNPETGLFRHHGDHPSRQRQWLSSISYHSGVMTFPGRGHSSAPSYQESVEAAEKLLQEAPSYRVESGCQGDGSLFLEPEVEQLRWFLLPNEAAGYLTGHLKTTPPTTPPFQPRKYHASGGWEGEIPCNDVRGKLQNGLEQEQVSSDCVEDGGCLESVPAAVSGMEWKPKFHHPPKNILKPTIEAIEEYHMLRDGDRVLVCLSGGKDSLSLLHTLWQYHFLAASKGVHFSLGAVTVDPGSASYNPRPLIPYLAALGVPYFFEEQGILQKAVSLGEDCTSICSFCSRMKRGRLYSCARREGYNVLALGQHLDDLAESFLMSAFHNGLLRTMKAAYTVKEGDLRVIRPLVYVREVHLRGFADSAHLPVIAENCPACFEAPKERHRVKQLLAGQEVLYPRLFPSLQAAMRPLMARDRTGLEGHSELP
jgi:tRNA(Ile)-lysidine synthase TilS/MesJ